MLAGTAGELTGVANENTHVGMYVWGASHGATCVWVTAIDETRHRPTDVDKLQGTSSVRGTPPPGMVLHEEMRKPLTLAATPLTVIALAVLPTMFTYEAPDVIGRVTEVAPRLFPHRSKYSQLTDVNTIPLPDTHDMELDPIDVTDWRVEDDTERHAGEAPDEANVLEWMLRNDPVAYLGVHLKMRFGRHTQTHPLHFQPQEHPSQLRIL